MVDTVIGTDDADRAELPQLERVLLAARGSFAGLAGGRWCVARSRTQPLTVQVSVAPDVVPSTHDEAAHPAAAAQRVHDYLNLVEPTIESTLTLLSADREADLLDASLETDLLVLATTTNDAESGTGSASFVWRVAMQAASATVIVPRAWTPTAGPVVVGIGDGIGEYAALDRAAAEAERQGLPLVLLRASQLPASIDRSVAGDLDVEFSDGLDRQSLEDATTYVASRFSDLTVRTVLTGANPLDALIDQGRGASLIVVGTRRSVGSSGGSDSVVSSIVELPPCPVMVVPPQP